MSWTKLIRFIAKEDGKEYYGDCITRGDIGLLYHQGKQLQAHPLLLHSASDHSEEIFTNSPSSSVDTSSILTVSKLLSPLSSTLITSIRGLGLQYATPPHDQAQAQPPPPPEIACLFLKPTSTITSPSTEILIPRQALDEKNDYECELCVIIGDRDVPKNTKTQNAMDYVGGFTVVNDVSSRGLCAKGGAGQWGIGKNYDTWCPIGPCVIKPTLEPLEFNTKLNDKLVQKGNTSNLLLSIPKLIETLSIGSTLEKHSLILTGSPVALGRKLPGDVSKQSPFMKHGDKVECWVQGIGTLVNTVREEKDTGTNIKPYKAKL